MAFLLDFLIHFIAFCTPPSSVAFVKCNLIAMGLGKCCKYIWFAIFCRIVFIWEFQAKKWTDFDPRKKKRVKFASKSTVNSREDVIFVKKTKFTPKYIGKRKVCFKKRWKKILAVPSDWNWPYNLSGTIEMPHLIARMSFPHRNPHSSLQKLHAVTFPWPRAVRPPASTNFHTENNKKQQQKNKKKQKLK